jgi:hypothetical protein
MRTTAFLTTLLALAVIVCSPASAGPRPEGQHTARIRGTSGVPTIGVDEQGAWCSLAISRLGDVVHVVYRSVPLYARCAAVTGTVGVQTDAALVDAPSIGAAPRVELRGVKLTVRPPIPFPVP